MDADSGGGRREDKVEASLKSATDAGLILDEIWTQYTEENEEKFFRKYVKGFISHWEDMPDNCKLSEDWNKLVTSCLEQGPGEGGCRGPFLSILPDELLAALSKFLFVGKDQIESEGTVDVQSVIHMREITTCLTIIICQNCENIPLVGSMAFVTQLTQTCSLLLSHLLQMESSFFASSGKASAGSTSGRKKPNERKDKHSGKPSNTNVNKPIPSLRDYFLHCV